MQTDVLVIGSGAAGYACATRIAQGGKNVIIATNSRLAGTSRNAGSDKQTYYKMQTGGEGADGVLKMAETLYSGGAMNGRHALIESACSQQCFFWLTELGVPFVKNEFGEFLGYRTDHDETARASSAGPLTSKLMTQVLETEALKSCRLRDNHTLIYLLESENVAYGAVFYVGDKECDYRIIYAENTVLACGGQGNLYADSVYPASQTGGIGVAAFAGATCQNLHIWQYGIASKSPRWNLSGSYQQALPRYFSRDDKGEYDFLAEYFKSDTALLDAIFLKGYEWPFDPKKASSIIDVAVSEQCAKGRKVYLDFSQNPPQFSGFDGLKCREYLKNSNALLPTPIERLEKLNPAAIGFYRSKGVDLYCQLLEISVCAQHNNGGLKVDNNWQTSLDNLYAVGEVAGTHGNRRPGGSALNAGQVGALRAAQDILSKAKREMRISFDDFVLEQISTIQLQRSGLTPQNLKNSIGRVMSDFCAINRDEEKMKSELELSRERLCDTLIFNSDGDVRQAWEGLNLLKAQYLYLGAMLAAKQTPPSEKIILTTVKFTEMSPIIEANFVDPTPIPNREIWFENAAAEMYNKLS